MDKEILNEIRKFCSINKNIWNKNRPLNNKNQYFLMEMSHRSYSHSLAGRIASAIEMHANVKTIILHDRFTVPNYIKSLYHSFNIYKFQSHHRYFFNLWILIRSLFASIFCYLKFRDGNKFIKYHFMGINIGDLIYDELIRFTPGLYTIEKIQASYFKKIFWAHFKVLFLHLIFRSYEIKFVYCRLVVFIDGGILARVANKFDASVIMLNDKIAKNYKGRDIAEGQYTPRKEFILSIKNKETISKAEEYLNQRLGGKILDADVQKAYKDKTYYTKESLEKKLGLKPNLPIVFIMPHAFSDGSHHTNHNFMLYQDYYTWYIETLKIISLLKNANWLIKPHPLSSKYGEDNVASKIFNSFKSPYMALVPDDFNNASIIDIAHCIVTVTGKAGLEYACYGIPPVVACKANYSGYGFTIEPQTIDEYKAILGNINSLKRLNPDQISMAKVLIAHMFLKMKSNNILLPLTSTQLIRLSELEKWKLINQNIQSYDIKNDEFYQKSVALIKLEFN